MVKFSLQGGSIVTSYLDHLQAVLCKILFKNILKIQDKDSLKKYLEDTKIG